MSVKCDRVQIMTDDELKALVASLAVSQKQTDEQLKRTDEKLERIGITVGNICNNQGAVAEEFFFNSLIDDLHIGDLYFDEITKNMEKHRGKKQEEYDLLLANGDTAAVAEEFFFNSLIKNLHIGDMYFDEIIKNMEKHRGKKQEEYDLLLVNGNTAAIIEVKYKAHSNDLKKLDRKIQNFKPLFPDYKDYKVYGGLASFHFNDNAKEETLNRGYFVLQRSGNIISSSTGDHLKAF